jgi:hypothetical protein
VVWCDVVLFVPPSHTLHRILHPPPKAWLTFAPDEVLALAFMVDLDNDGIVSWTDFYSFAVLAEQVTTAT